jgi:hypothetical protein
VVLVVLGRGKASDFAFQRLVQIEVVFVLEVGTEVGMLRDRRGPLRLLAIAAAATAATATARTVELARLRGQFVRGPFCIDVVAVRLAGQFRPFERGGGDVGSERRVGPS